MSNRALMTLLASLIFIFACAQKKSSAPTETEASGVARLDPNLPPAVRERIVKNWVVTCHSSGDDANDCPEAIAQMISVDHRQETTLCTATLIAPDLMLTNSHCFEVRESAQAELCASTKFVFAATTAKPAESAECKEIVFKSKLVEKRFDRPDYMVIRLKAASARKPLTITREGIAQHQDLIVHRIDPNVHTGNSVLQTAHCTALQNTVFLPSGSSNSDPVVVTRDCEIIDGNSGSPLTNKNGEIAAIAFASVAHGKRAIDLSVQNGDMVALAAQKAFMARVTNFACLRLPAPFTAPADGCRTLTRAELSLMDRESDALLSPKLNWSSIETAVSKDLTERSLIFDSRLGFHIAASADGTLISYTPYCLNAPATWAQTYSQNPQPILANELRWNLTWLLDDDFKGVARLDLRGDLEVHALQFDAKMLATSSGNLVKDLTASTTSTWDSCAVNK